MLKVNLCRPGAKMPTYATQGSACFDLYVPDGHTCVLRYGEPVVVPTGLKFDIPKGYVLFIYSRSGHGFKNDIRLSNCVGVIDSDYTDEVMIKLIQDVEGYDHGTGVYVPFHINPGDRIAQAMLMPVQQVDLVQIDEPPVQKGNRTGGFGSTGA